jgi:hypothetical protein
MRPDVGSRDTNTASTGVGIFCPRGAGTDEFEGWQGFI